MSEESRQVAQKHLRQVKKMREARERAERAFHAAIYAAHQAEETYRDIGVWAGLSHQQVNNICRAWERQQAGE